MFAWCIFTVGTVDKFAHYPFSILFAGYIFTVVFACYNLPVCDKYSSGVFYIPIGAACGFIDAYYNLPVCVKYLFGASYIPSGAA